ncbi:polyprenyl synthetase family protein [Heliorestis convoluta]|uniref:Farnesyltranstransferase n=1 Tax=Heliorestis convoluta TaxID=356322 RepID=A0A5Q2N599_9FIRM|nr:polyprenyl synthetase family protein [Heliorestis convoluta]QGG47755.1 Putative farnesyltranstransferase [Heliorestis convoluta]
MSWNIWESLLPELAEVRLELKDKIPLPVNYGTNGSKKGLYDVQKMLPAILVFLTTRMYGETDRSTRYLALSVQFIQAATDIHRTVPEESWNRQSLEQQMIPSSVLMGDLLYAQAVDYLCEGQLFSYLDRVSEAICRIHEGAVIRKEIMENAFTAEERLEKAKELEFATLSALACRLAGEIHGVAPQDLKALEQFGRVAGLLAGQGTIASSMLQCNIWLKQGLEALGDLPSGVMNDAGQLLLTQLTGFSWNEIIPMSVESKNGTLTGKTKKVVV